MINLKNIKQEHLWYIVGFIATDGNLGRDGRHINITSKDRDHLFLIRDILRLQSKIGLKNSSTQKQKIYSILQFSDVSFYEYLESIGLFPRKSLTLEDIAVPNNYFHDFFRGIIDGDGCICTWIHKGNGYRQWSLTITSAAPLFISWLKQETEKCFDVRGRLHTYKFKGKKNEINILRFGKLAAKVIINKAYYEGALSLDRKDLKGKLCLQDPNLMVNYGNVVGPGAVTGSQRGLKIPCP
jgi:hypothetical protein